MKIAWIQSLLEYQCFSIQGEFWFNVTPFFKSYCLFDFTFYDFRLPINSNKRDHDVQLVESILESKYNMYAIDVQVSLTETNPEDTHSRI